MLGELLLAARLTADPRVASHLGALLAGEPQLGPVLERIAWRECRWELCSTHRGDAWMEHSLGKGRGTRGVHGQVVPFALQYGPTWARSWSFLLDVPLASAWLGARRAASWRCRATAGCRSWLGVG